MDFDLAIKSRKSISELGDKRVGKKASAFNVKAVTASCFHFSMSKINQRVGKCFFEGGKKHDLK
jgi:hypothetical protein